MSWITLLLAVIAGFALGLLVAVIMRLAHSRTADRLADQLFKASEARRKADTDAIIETLKGVFGNLSLDALSKSTDEFLKLAKSRLDSERDAGSRELESKKTLIDQQLRTMTVELEKVSSLMRGFENDRIEKFAELSSRLKTTGEQTTALLQITGALKEALANSRIRGRWGERIAEDVLRIAGFVENINYRRQRWLDSDGSRPDFTFLLPRGLTVNMDVKFPLDNYVRYIEAEGEGEKVRCRNEFLRDVRARIKEVSNRKYINPEQNTLDYVLLFIPNEQVYTFIHEQDNSLLDDGLKNKVVFCSPVTLFAVLAVIRHAVDNFALEVTSHEILSLLGSFKKQWDEFLKKLEQVGKRIDEAQREYEVLTTTRRRQLERPLNRIEAIRTERGLTIGPLPADDSLLSVEGLAHQED